MTIAHDSGMLVSSILTRLRGVSIDHLAVLWNTMAVTGCDIALGLFWGLGGWGPGKVISADLNVIVGEFSELVVIHTEEFGFLRGAEVKTWDSVDGIGDNC